MSSLPRAESGISAKNTGPAGSDVVRALLCACASRIHARVVEACPMILSPILTLDPTKVEGDLGFLMDCLYEVLEESREHALASHLPWRQTVSSAAPDTISPERLSQAYSIAF